MACTNKIDFYANHKPSAACYIHVCCGARDFGLAVLSVDLWVRRVASVYADFTGMMWWQLTIWLRSWSFKAQNSNSSEG